MKKLTFLFLLFFVISILSYGQKVNYTHFNETQQSQVEIYKKSDVMAHKDILDIGDTLWYEDFGGGALPAGWQVYDSTGNNFNWIWSLEGPNGAYTYPSGSGWPNHINPLNSTTAANGFMLLPSDYYNTTPGGVIVPNIITMNAYFMTSPIDCSTDTSVMVVFQQLFRFCCSDADAVFSLGVSIDGTTWYEYDVRHGISGNKITDDPDIVKVNITDVAAGQDTVYLHFWQTGVSHYYWMIDDIALVVAPDNDIQIDQTYISALAEYPNGMDFHGFYSKIPASQIMQMFYQADAFNFGNDLQTNIILSVDVTDTITGATVFSGTDDTIQLSKDSIAALVLQDYFTPAGPGVFSSHFELTQDQTDDVPENNVYDAVSYSVTDNNIFARDAKRTTSVSITQYANWADGDFAGTTYFITNSVNVLSISMYISSSSWLGETIIPQLHINNGAAWDDYTVQIEGDEHEIVAEDLGTWITLPLIPYVVGSEILLAQTEYCAGVEMYLGDRRLYLGADDDAKTHMFSYEARLRIAQNWGWISRMPMIRLNLDGAVLPPVFTSAPNKIIYTGDPWYHYDVTVSDPNGLPVTITSTDLHDGLTITDNGDNTATVTGYPTGATLNDSVLISLKADNGTSQNEQNFYAKVTWGINDINDSKIKIYPNPSKGLINITNTLNSQLFVYNLVGEVITSIKNAKATTQIDLSGYGAGTYIVKVISGDQVVNQKLNLIR
jgi:hypothetical protein